MSPLIVHDGVVREVVVGLWKFKPSECEWGSRAGPGAPGGRRGACAGGRAPGGVRRGACAGGASSEGVVGRPRRTRSTGLEYAAVKSLTP